MNHESTVMIKGTILIVDDIPENLKFLHEMLSVEGYKVRSALNGKMAIQSAIAKVPDLILLDVLMPNMDGFELCRELKSLPEIRDVPIIFVSALNNALEKVKAFSVGGADYISKPIAIPEAIARIEHQLNISRLRQQIVEQNASLAAEVDIRRQTEDSLKLLLQEVTDIKFALDQSAIVVITDLQGRITYVNDKFCAISKYSREEVLGHTHQLVNSQYHPKEFFQQMWHTIRQGEVWKGEIRNRAKDGTFYWVDTVIVPMLGADGQPCQYVSIRQDISDRNRATLDKLRAKVAHWHRMQAEEELRLLQSVAINMNDAVIITKAAPLDDTGPEIIYVNQAFTQKTGYQAYEVLGKTPRILQGPKTNPSTRLEIRTALEAWQPVTAELLNYTKDGTEFWVEISITPLSNQEGLVTHWISVQRDISERKIAEAEILKSLKRERELNELKTNIVSMVSHEYRTPLATILSSLDLLEHYGHMSTEQENQDYCQQIRVAVQRMTDLLSDVLTLNKSDAGLIQFNPAPLNVENFCRDLIAELQNTPNSKHHSIQLSFEGEPCQESLDAKLLDCIFSNLILNAVKYSPDGGTIRFDVTCHHEVATFAVRDQGMGIPAQAMPQIFQSFFRGNNVGNIEGTGLGLAIVKHLVDVHQGKITVESQVGVGSTFVVTLPLRNEA